MLAWCYSLACHLSCVSFSVHELTRQTFLCSAPDKNVLWMLRNWGQKLEPLQALALLIYTANEPAWLSLNGHKRNI